MKDFKVYQPDLEDAFSVLCVIADVEDDSDEYGREIRHQFDLAIAKANLDVIDFNLAQKIRRSSSNRKIRKDSLNNAIIVGKTMSGKLIALDGNHRLFEHIKKESEKIPILFIDISFLEDADDMTFEFGE